MYDKNFLKRLDLNRTKETYIKIISLTNEDLPVEEITGQATGGSINIDGTSSVRRSCSLSMTATKEDNIITDKYWAYNHKFKLQIGLKNTIDRTQPDIIWFEQGVYIISNFSISESTSNLTISIQGKDKMCRLDGTISGSLPAQHDFGKEEIENANGTISFNLLPLYTIIREAVHEYAQEPMRNIIINDLDDYGYELMEYRGEKPMYLFVQPGNGNYPVVLNITLNGDTKVKININETTFCKLNEFEDKGYKFYSLNALDRNYNNDATQIILNPDNNTGIGYVVKVQSGETAGYHQIALTYANDLILNAGEPITIMLNKIAEMLGNFEYFYDTKGRFIFQKKNNYIQELFSPINGEIVEPIAAITPYSYRFDDKELITQINNTPNVENTKNDFAIWGQRNGADGSIIAIHARYAVDKKPERYHRVYIQEFYDNLDKNRKEEKEASLMEIDNNANLTNDEKAKRKAEIEKNYELKTEYWNSEKEDMVFITRAELLEEGETGFPCDWRELLYRMAVDYQRYREYSSFLTELEKANPQFIGGRTKYEQYYTDILGFWRQLYNPTPSEEEKKNYFDVNGYDKKGAGAYWNKDVYLNPSNLYFWFDFLDTEGELGKYSANKIGSRSKVINEPAIKSIYYKETPEVQFIILPTEAKELTKNNAYTKIQIQDNMTGLFYRSTQGNAAVSRANELISEYTATAEGLNLTCIPIYYLEPNTRIYVDGIGDCTLDRISYNLSYNGTMSISGNKILKTFY